ncbi:hypothetical protein O181_031337 [Austropuccinia psidii MF-1]|uniref:Cytochrome b5 heme-binding domain-containing protein n=1 Tax=Austropuccinia psidii MF-1 TaxID=1389203 RepID=A0A9Q3H593_9BASI|nr:hypothetical protein [Austropuccinia psidii MF-1]
MEVRLILFFDSHQESHHGDSHEQIIFKKVSQTEIYLEELRISLGYLPSLLLGAAIRQRLTIVAISDSTIFACSFNNSQAQYQSSSRRFRQSTQINRLILVLSMSEDKDFTVEELAELSKPENLHLLISGKVYAISKFLEEHPGGDEVLLGEAGKDATESFEDVGHSDEARALMKQYYVGTCKESAPKGTSANKKSTQHVYSNPATQSGGWGFMIPLAVLVAYLSYRFYFGS